MIRISVFTILFPDNIIICLMLLFVCLFGFFRGRSVLIKPSPWYSFLMITLVFINNTQQPSHVITFCRESVNPPYPSSILYPGRGQDTPPHVSHLICHIYTKCLKVRIFVEVSFLYLQSTSTPNKNSGNNDI